MNCLTKKVFVEEQRQREAETKRLAGIDNPITNRTPLLQVLVRAGFAFERHHASQFGSREEVRYVARVNGRKQLVIVDNQNMWSYDNYTTQPPRGGFFTTEAELVAFFGGTPVEGLLRAQKLRVLAETLA